MRPSGSPAKLERRRVRAIELLHDGFTPVEVAREISHLYGDQYLNPPSTLIFIVDRLGEVHTLPFGIKSADNLYNPVMSFLNQ